MSVIYNFHQVLILAFIKHLFIPQKHLVGWLTAQLKPLPYNSGIEFCSRKWPYGSMQCAAGGHFGVPPTNHASLSGHCCSQQPTTGEVSWHGSVVVGKWVSFWEGRQNREGGSRSCQQQLAPGSYPRPSHWIYAEQNT